MVYPDVGKRKSTSHGGSVQRVFARDPSPGRSMRDALSKVLGHHEEEAGIDRILAAAFFRKRPLQAGASARVVHLADRRAATSRETTVTDSFLVRGGRR